MKTSIKLIISALFVSLTVLSPVFAIDTPNQSKAFAVVMYPAADASKLWLNLQKYQSDNKVSLTLVNKNGTVLFQETIAGKNSKQSTYRQQFDISDLKDGNYTFRISAGNQKEEITFKLVTPTLEAVTPIRLIAIN